MSILPIEYPPSELDCIRVQGVMAYPNNEHLIVEHWKVMYANGLIEAEADLPHSIAKSVLEAPPYQKCLERFMIRMQHGSIAGDILIYLFHISESGMEEPSINKASYAVWHSYKVAMEENKRRKIPLSVRSFLDKWKRFKSVAPLWAAARYLAPKHGLNPGAFIPVFPGDLAELLAFSELFRLFGEDHLDRRSKKLLFEPDETWRPPEGFLLPEVSINVSETQPWLEEVLGRYTVEDLATI